jgi:predicted ATPase
MKLDKLTLERFRKAKHVSMAFDGLTVCIGPNAVGKSNILDALRMLATAALTGDFWGPAVSERGSFVNLTWKGEQASSVRFVARFSQAQGPSFEWSVELRKDLSEFSVWEYLESYASHDAAPQRILVNQPNERWWWDPGNQTNHRQKLAIPPTACGLRLAGANEAFPGRAVFDLLRTWVFADPNPGSMRFPCSFDQPHLLDIHGRNLAARLYAIRKADQAVYARIRKMLGEITGLAIEELDVKQLGEDRLALSVRETGLAFPVNQPAMSAGTLRSLALVVVLAGSGDPGLVAIEEPENYLHPRALEVLVEVLLEMSRRTQVVMTTHSPIVLNCLSAHPEAVCVVTATAQDGTTVQREPSPEAVRKALRESGFSLGDYHLSMGGFAGRGTP